MNMDTQRYRAALVETLTAQGELSSERVKAAFASVPRHAFVYSFYERQGNIWQQREATASDDWYQQVYRNQALITLVDEAGRVLSSSSQPGIMAQMLELLDLQPGQRVLEIGTGTGYHAALLAAIVGETGQVVTVDIEADIAEKARQHLYAAGCERVQVVHGDGRQGYSAVAPYDRIIATGSSFPVPEAWDEQLTREGIVVCVIQPGMSMAGGVMRAVKTLDGLTGRVVQEACFMPLHQADFRSRPANRPHLTMSEPMIATFTFDTRLFDPAVLWTAAFQFFLYANFPTLHIVEQMRSDERMSTLLYEEQQPQHYVSLSQEKGQDRVELCGAASRSLWTRLIRVYTLWVALDRPTITSYMFKLHPGEQQQLFLSGEKGMVWPFVS
ncbi:MAG: methyltransferase domain-containing protein [Ktedonobacteraceae bacterium]